MTAETEVTIVHDHNTIDFDRPGKSMYEVAFHYDGTWGNALAPLAVINGAAGPGKSVVCFGGTHGNEYEGQVAVWRLMHELDPAQISGRVILMPRLNTPACISGTRESRMDHPHHRPAESVAEDVRNGYISREVAREGYGVALDEALNVDEATTWQLRRQQGDE